MSKEFLGQRGISTSTVLVHWNGLPQKRKDGFGQLSPIYQEWDCTLRIKNILAQLFLNPHFSRLKLKAEFNTAPVNPLGCKFSSFIVNSIYFSIQVQLQSEKQPCKIALNFLERDWQETRANLLSTPGQHEVGIILLTHQYYCQLILNVILETARLSLILLYRKLIKITWQRLELQSHTQSFTKRQNFSSSGWTGRC